MPRPNRQEDRRAELTPELARVFAELGYRRSTTALLAERLGVAENALYRLWPDKRAMFCAALDHVYSVSEAAWSTLLESDGDGRSAAARILEFEARHHGELGLYRIVFAGLSETDDAKIRAGLVRLYRRFQRFVAGALEEATDDARPPGAPSIDALAWAFLGLGTVASIGRELGLLGRSQRAELLGDVGGLLLANTTNGARAATKRRGARTSRRRPS